MKIPKKLLVEYINEVLAENPDLHINGYIINEAGFFQRLGQKIRKGWQGVKHGLGRMMGRINPGASGDNLWQKTKNFLNRHRIIDNARREVQKLHPRVLQFFRNLKRRRSYRGFPNVRKETTFRNGVRMIENFYYDIVEDPTLSKDEKNALITDLRKYVIYMADFELWETYKFFNESKKVKKNPYRYLFSEAVLPGYEVQLDADEIAVMKQMEKAKKDGIKKFWTFGIAGGLAWILTFPQVWDWIAQFLPVIKEGTETKMETLKVLESMTGPTETTADGFLDMLNRIGGERMDNMLEIKQLIIQKAGSLEEGIQQLKNSGIFINPESADVLYNELIKDDAVLQKTSVGEFFTGENYGDGYSKYFGIKKNAYLIFSKYIIKTVAIKTATSTIIPLLINIMSMVAGGLLILSAFNLGRHILNKKGLVNSRIAVLHRLLQKLQYVDYSRNQQQQNQNQSQQQAQHEPASYGVG